MKLEESKVWRAEYRCIHIKIIQWRLGWNYYLTIPKDLFVKPEEFDEHFWLGSKVYQICADSPKRLGYDYEHIPVDMHRGITWYRKFTSDNPDVEPHMVEVGCDYQHYNDTPGLNVQQVLFDAWHSVNSLRDRFKLYCQSSYDGSLHHEEAGRYIDDANKTNFRANGQL